LTLAQGEGTRVGEAVRQHLMRAACYAARLKIVMMMVFSVAGSGCEVVTNLGTSGYQMAEAGRAPDAACKTDACFDFECLGAGDCPNGWVCCLDVSSTTSAGFVCTMGPACSGPVPLQLCRTDVECPGSDAGAAEAGPSCVHQRCSLGGNTVELEACGAVPGCFP